MGKQRRSYSAEFKLEALRLLETSGKSAAEIERELGIGDGCLRQWKFKLKASGDQAFPGHGNVSADQEELVRLRRELEIVRQERDILKKQRPSSRAQTHEIPVHRRQPQQICGGSDVQDAGGVAERLLRLAQPAAERARDGQPRAEGDD
jgi:transposase